MHKWGLSVEMASLFFVFNMIVYFIGLQFLDTFTNKFGMIFAIWVGVLFTFIGPLFVYPMEFLPQILTSTIFGLSLLGLSGAAINVPCLLQLGRYVKERNESLDENTINDISSALYNFGVNVGDFTGPIMGGAISDKYGFKYSCLFMGVIGLVYSLVFGVYYYRDIYKEVLNKKEEEGMDVGLIGEEGSKIEMDLYRKY